MLDAGEELDIVTIKQFNRLTIIIKKYPYEKTHPTRTDHVVLHNIAGAEDRERAL
jgi:hypothetical protein